MLTEEQFKAIDTCNTSFDNIFYYGVKTTKIVCKPSCRSKTPRKENIRIFDDVNAALKEGFRPCKRCKPTNEVLPDVEWIEQVKQYLKRTYDQKHTLESIADECHSSPYHLHRTFKKLNGVTIKTYLHNIRMAESKRLLEDTTLTIAEVGSCVGIPNPSQFSRLYKEHHGKNPKAVRKDNV